MAARAPQIVQEARSSAGVGDSTQPAAMASPGLWFYMAGAQPLPLPDGTLQAPVRDVHLAGFAAARYPGLLRGQVVSVHRPWQVGRPLESLLAARIRHHQTSIIRQTQPQAPPASEHHLMLYAGGGQFWSQDQRYELVPLSNYDGCILTFWDAGWSLEARNALVAECAVHAGETYGYLDILAIYAWAVTGDETWLERLEDRRHWICSEAVCALVSAWADPRISQGQECVMRLPQITANWMLAAGYRPLALRIHA